MPVHCRFGIDQYHGGRFFKHGIPLILRLFFVELIVLVINKAMMRPPARPGPDLIGVPCTTK